MIENFPILICGSGNSLPFNNARYFNNHFKHGLDLKLEELIQYNYSIGLNYFWKYGCETTLMSFVDWQFYEDNLNSLKYVPLIVGCDDPSFKKIPVHSNTILLKDASKINLITGIKEGLYAKQLVGIWALSLAINLGFKKIYLCYDKNTEVFTNEGWKYFQNLTGDEKVLTRKAGGATEWSNIIALQKYKYNGYMKSLKQRGIDLLVTPNHPFYLESDIDYIKPKGKYHPFQKDGYIHRTVEEFNTTNYKIPKTFKWNGKKSQYFILPAIQGKWITEWGYNIRKKIKIEPWLKFLGVYISDGCLSNYSKIKSYKIILYQNHTKIKDKYIKTILKQLPFKYYKTKRGWAILNKQLYAYLEQNIGMNSYTKNIPVDLKNLSITNLKFLLEGLIFGDGTNGYKREMFYFTSSKQLADDVQEISYKCGYYAGISWRKGRICQISKHKNIGVPQWTVYLNKTSGQGNLNSISVKNLVFNKKIKDVLYDDFVYDLTAQKNHVIWVRRNNQCVWSGNCGFDACEINGRTHFYQGVVDLKKTTPIYIKGKLVVEREHFRGIGKKENGQYKTSTYQNKKHLNEIWFKPFLGVKDVQIFNVSPESAIDIFPKITYDELYNHIKINKLSQVDMRNTIKDIIQEKVK